MWGWNIKISTWKHRPPHSSRSVLCHLSPLSFFRRTKEISVLRPFTPLLPFQEYFRLPFSFLLSMLGVLYKRKLYFGLLLPSFFRKNFSLPPTGLGCSPFAIKGFNSSDFPFLLLTNAIIIHSNYFPRKEESYKTLLDVHWLVNVTIKEHPGFTRYEMRNRGFKWGNMEQRRQLPQFRNEKLINR